MITKKTDQWYPLSSLVRPMHDMLSLIQIKFTRMDEPTDLTLGQTAGELLCQPLTMKHGRQATPIRQSEQLATAFADEPDGIRHQIYRP